jgi:hypothetical protein
MFYYESIFLRKRATVQNISAGRRLLENKCELKKSTMASTLKESDLDVKTRRGIYDYQRKSLVLVCDSCFIYSTLP